MTHLYWIALVSALLAFTSSLAHADGNGALNGTLLPAWETAAEQAYAAQSQPVLGARVINGDDGLLPPPPPTGFRAPAEFEPVGAVMVSQGGWFDYGMLTAMIKGGTQDGGAARAIVVSTKADFGATLKSKGVDMLRAVVVVPPARLDGQWARDFGPLSIFEPGSGGADGDLAFVDMHYYAYREGDDAVTGYLAEQIGLSRYGLEGSDHTPPDTAKLLMEGGNFQTDGHGTCVMSDDMATDNKANPDADTLDKVSALLRDYLGCEQMIWLTPPPKTGTGHVDMYTKLLTPHDFLVVDFREAGDAMKGQADAAVDAAAAALEAAKNLDDEPFVVHRITIPPTEATMDAARRAYKTYTNSVMLNKVVLVPTYNAPKYDAAALQVYQDVLGTDYTVVGIPSLSTAPSGGAVHCTTMQIASTCGNGLREPLLEACEGDDFGGEGCKSLGFAEGSLACDSLCRFDVSDCSGVNTDPDPDTNDTDTGNDSDEATDSTARPTSDSDLGTADTESDGEDNGNSSAVSCSAVRLGAKRISFFDLLRMF